MKILVTGGLGFIGHNVMCKLEILGHEVSSVDTKTRYGVIAQAEQDHLMAARMSKLVTVPHSMDICKVPDMNWVFEEYRPEIVINLASPPRQHIVDLSPLNSSRTMSEGLLNLLELSRSHKVKKFVHISSSMVYGNFIDNVTEDAPCSPIGKYGILKLAGELLVRDHTRRYNLPHTIIRPSAVYGPLDVSERVVARFLLAAMHGDVLTVNGSAEALDFTDVEDVSDGIVSATLSSNTVNKTYNLTRGQGRTLLEAASMAIRIAGKGTLDVKDKDDHFPSRGMLNIDAARKDFEYNPTIDIEEGFKNYHEWLNGNTSFWSGQTIFQS